MPIVCNCEEGGKCQIHPKPSKPASVPQVDPSLLAKGVGTAVPEIPIEDKLTLKTLQVEALTAALNASNAAQQARNAQDQVNLFGMTICEKMGLSPEDWLINFGTMTFVERKK